MTGMIFGMPGMEVPKEEIVKEPQAEAVGPPLRDRVGRRLPPLARRLVPHRQAVAVTVATPPGRDHGVTELLGLS